MAFPDNTALEADAPTDGRRRVPAVDVARGIAVLAMVSYHTAWDLSELALIRTQVTDSFGWSLYARAIAATFLTLAGTGLVLAHGDRLRRRAFVKRLGIVALAALAITAVTRVVFPESFIFFGVLHNIAVSSVIALPFLRAPAVLVGAVAALAWAAPLLVRAPIFDAAILAFLGLGSVPPVTNDFVPILPWTGFVLAGLLAGRLLRSRWPAGAGRPGRLVRGLAALGRHSLIIYLVHQPLIFGALSGLREIVGPDPVAEASPFVGRCTANCRQAGAPEILCRATCSCTVEELKREDRWKRIIASRPAGDDVPRMSELASSCFQRSRGKGDGDEAP